MKKFFLIPLLTLMCSVMAWADNVAKVGTTEYPTVQAALNAAESGATVELLANVTETLKFPKSVRLTGNKTITSTNEMEITGADITLTFAGVNFNVTYDAFNMQHKGTINLVVEDGTTNSIRAATAGCDGFYGFADNSEKLIISGNGSLVIEAAQYVAHIQHLEINAPNVVAKKSAKGTFKIYGSAVIYAGQFEEDLPQFVASTSIVTKPAEYYVVAPATGVAVYNQTKLETYNTLQAAVDAAEDGDRIIMYTSDNTAVAVSKNLVIDNGTNAINVSAGAGYTKIGDATRTVITNNALVAYLQDDETSEFTIDANTDITAVGLIKIKGNKIISINEDVIVTCQNQLPKYSFVVPNGASLTIKGKGTIKGDKHIINVEKGGTLVIGKEDKSDQPKFETTENDKVNLAILNYGTTTIYNSYIKAKSAAIHNYGNMTILGGTYTGEASTANDHKYCVTTDGGSKMTLKNATVKGVHGAVACQSLDEGNNSFATIDNCTLIATDKPNGTHANDGTVHYGLYTATTAVVSVYNTKILSTNYDRGAVIGNNDAMSTFGLVYLYDGCMLKNKLYVQKRKTTDSQVLFPVSVDENSEWYKAAVNGGVDTQGKLLPINCQYVAITEGQDGYSEGYRWKVVDTTPVAQKESASTDGSATIPWQQETTWTGDVPAATDVVTIPEGKVVVVKNNEATTDVVAAQVKLQGEGASLTVEDGTSLAIGQSLNITTGAKLVVEAGAMVTVGAAGVIAAEDAAIEVKTSESKSGIYMIAPGVKENTHPMAKVDLVSKAYKRGEDDYVWQRFGLPAYMTGVKRGDMIYDHTAYPTSVLKLDYEKKTWASMANEDEFVPFRCYELTTTNPVAGGVYTFPCNLMGNGNAELELVADWNYYANSYTAPIDIAELISSVDANNSDNVSGTVYLYRASDNWWYEINLASLGEDGIPTVIDPMQAFIFQRRALGGSNPEVNYKDHIWDPIMNQGSSPAPARTRATYNKAIVEITAADGTKDIVRLIEGERFSDEFDNTWDAAKYMNAESFNLFADAQDEKMGILATDDLEGTTLSMTTKNQTSFTMTFSNVNGMNYAVRDMLTGTETVINENESYMFSVPANTTVEGRFEIVAANKVATSIDNIEETAAVKGIYTVTGQFVGKDYHNLPNGVYVVDGKKIVK